MNVSLSYRYLFAALLTIGSLIFFNLLMTILESTLIEPAQMITYSFALFSGVLGWATLYELKKL